MAKHRNAVSVFCRLHNAASACNVGGSSSLHTRMNAAARLMQPLRCAATHLKTSHRFLHHARVKHTAHASTGTTSAAHSTARAAAAAPALSSRDPASHAPSPPQPSSTTCGPCAYRQAQSPVDRMRTPHSGARGALAHTENIPQQRGRGAEALAAEGDAQKTASGI